MRFHWSVPLDMLPDYLLKTIPATLLAEVTKLKNDIVVHSHDFIDGKSTVLQNPEHQKSAVNLSHYLALRQYDLRQIQDRLSELGLTSLGACEGHVLATLNQVICLLGKKNNCINELELSEGVPGFQEGRSFLEKNTSMLFGESRDHRQARIMVTMPGDAATNIQLIDSLIESGMDTARINCAHDAPDVWKSIIDNIRLSANARGRDCKIMMDLSGQKIRTGPISQQERVIRIRVKRTVYGKVASPTFVELYPAEYFSEGQFLFEVEHRHGIPVSQKLLKQLNYGDRLVFKDARGRSRQLSIRKQKSNGIWLASTERNIYMIEGIKLHLQRKTEKWKNIDQGLISYLGTQDKIIRLYAEDRLRLTYDLIPALEPQLDDDGKIIRPAQISCSQAEALEQVQIGETVCIDDGKLCAVVESKDSSGLLVKVTHVSKQGLCLKEGKGINFPHTELNLPCLTEKDLHDLNFICRYADIVGYSFVQKAEDISSLAEELRKRKGQHLSIVAKIETKKGVRNLPHILLNGLRQNSFGIMIARGDLAVEIGGERLAEIQEEILWLCESAHIPVIWATQVLEMMSKKGITTRPELTDAAMSVRADCVMLNKGDHIVQSVKILDEIISRMEGHQYKKNARLRALHQWA